MVEQSADPMARKKVESWAATKAYWRAADLASRKVVRKVETLVATKAVCLVEKMGGWKVDSMVVR